MFMTAHEPDPREDDLVNQTLMQWGDEVGLARTVRHVIDGDIDYEATVSMRWHEFLTAILLAIRSARQK